MSEKQYEGGQADDRMLLAQDESPSRFRPRYRKLDDGELQRIDEIKAAADGLERLIRSAYCVKIQEGERFEAVADGKSSASREHALAITKLEECVIWAVKGLTG